MNDLTGERIGFVVTGSFCTFSAVFAQAKLLREAGAELTPIFSEHRYPFRHSGRTGCRIGEDLRQTGDSQHCTGRAAWPQEPAGSAGGGTLYCQYRRKAGERHHGYHSDHGGKVHAPAAETHCAGNRHQ